MSGLWLPRAADSRWASDRPSKSAASYVDLRQYAYAWHSTSAMSLAATPRPGSVFALFMNGNDTDLGYNGPSQTNVDWRMIASYPSGRNVQFWLGFPRPGTTPGSTANFSNMDTGNYSTKVLMELRVSPGFRGIPVQQYRTTGYGRSASITMDIDPAIEQHVWLGDIKHTEGGSGITVPNIKPWLGGIGVLGGGWVASDRGRRKDITLAGTWSSSDENWYGLIVGLR